MQVISRKKVLTLGVGSLTVAGLFAGTTFALFSASAKTATDTFTASQLCLTGQRDLGEPVPGPMFYVTAQQGATPSGQLGTFPTGVWAPGDLVARELNITNACATGSSMNAWLTSAWATVSTGTMPSSLADQLVVQILAPQPTDPTNYVLVAQGPLDEFLAGPVAMRFPFTYTGPSGATVNQVSLVKGGTMDLEFRVAFNHAAGNTYQGKTEVVDFHVMGVQQRNNTPYYSIGTLNQALMATTMAQPGSDGSFGYTNAQAVGLEHVANQSVETYADATNVGTITIETNNPAYSCLNGTAVNVWTAPTEDPYEYVVHNGGQGTQCAYGTWVFGQ